MSTEEKINAVSTEEQERTEETKLRDKDGDEWVLREDGWCCQAPCDCTGELKRHTCDEHVHFPLVRVDRDFGPLVDATPTGKDEQG